MRVLITTDIFPPDSGGPASYVPRIARELVRQGAAVRVLTYSSTPPSPELAAQDAAYPFAVERIYLREGRFRRLLRTWIRLWQTLARTDLVYVNGLLIETALANILTRRPAVAKVVGDIVWERAQDKGWTKDGFEEFQQRRYAWPIELRRRLRNWALRQMQAVIVPSRHLRETVIRWGLTPERVEVVYNGHSLPEQQPPPASIPLATKHRLITVGRLIPLKGIDHLIRLLPELEDTGLVVVGDGPEYSRLTSLAAELCVTGRVLFTGRVGHHQVQSYLRACDLFVLNSTHEGLPHVVLEALAAGLPVVATNVGGIPEILEDGRSGTLVPVGDQGALRAAIRDWLARVPAADVNLPLRFTERYMLQQTVDRLSRAAQKGGAG